MVVAEQDQVGDARPYTEPLEDRRLDGSPPSTIGGMKEDNIGCAALPKMLTGGALKSRQRRCTRQRCRYWATAKNWDASAETVDTLNSNPARSERDAFGNFEAYYCGQRPAALSFIANLISLLGRGRRTNAQHFFGCCKIGSRQGLGSGRSLVAIFTAANARCYEAI